MFNTSADLYRMTQVSAAMGGTTLSATLTEDDFPCRISNVPPSERLVGDTMFAEANGVIYCPQSLDVQRGDEIRTASVTYEVLGVRTPSKRNAHHEAIVRSEQVGV
jgi:hypothetical protein